MTLPAVGPFAQAVRWVDPGGQPEHEFPDGGFRGRGAVFTSSGSIPALPVTPASAQAILQPAVPRPVEQRQLRLCRQTSDGTKAGDYLLSKPGWEGTVPGGMTQISAPHNFVLVIGRVFVDGGSDQPTAYALAQQIRLASLKP